MARRRIRSEAIENIGTDSNFASSDILSSLMGLAGLVANRSMNQDLPDYSGTAPEIPQPEEREIPSFPTQGLPQGLELLGNLADAEAREDALDAVSDTTPPDPNPMLQSSFAPFNAVGHALSNYFSPEKREEMSAYNAELLRKAKEVPQEEEVYEGVVPQGASPTDIPPPEMSQKVPQMVMEEVEASLPPAVQESFSRGPIEAVSERDIPTEGLDAVPGAVEVAQRDPKVTQQIENMLNLKQGQFSDEDWKIVQSMENVLTLQEDQLNAQEKALSARLNRGEMTTADKVAIGLAIAIPAILGLLYGKEAFIGALGGSLEGLGKSFENMQQGDIKTSQRLAEIQQEKAKLAEKKQSLKKDFISKIQNPGMKKLFSDYDVINVVEDENGEPHLSLGKDAVQFGNQFGISAKDPEGALWYDVNLFRDDEDIKNFKEASKEGREAFSKMKDANEVLDDVLDIMVSISDQNPGMLSAISQNWQGVTSKLPGFENVTIDVKGEDGKARKVQALPLLRQKITALQDVYNKEYLGGNRLTSNLLKHWQDVFPDPSTFNAWLRSDLPTMVQQAQNFKSILNQRATENLVGQGFLREPLMQFLPVSGREILHSTSIDNEDIAKNPEKYRGKVRM